MSQKEKHYNKNGYLTGWSVKEGNKTEHYNRHGNFVGYSEDRGSYIQHYDRCGRSEGYSKEQTPLFGRSFIQHYDRDGRKGGYDTKEYSILCGEYTQHHDRNGRKTGWSESSGGSSDKGGSSGSSDCFITTACVRAGGLPDNCEELQIIRAFRDTYVRNLPNGEEIIREYYNIAPSIVAEINKREDSKEIYKEIKQEIEEVIRLVNLGKKKEAFTIYYNVVKRLKEEYLW